MGEPLLNAGDNCAIGEAAADTADDAVGYIEADDACANGDEGAGEDAAAEEDHAKHADLLGADFVVESAAGEVTDAESKEHEAGDEVDSAVFPHVVIYGCFFQNAPNI